MKKTVINIIILLSVFAAAWFAKGAISPTVVDNTVTDTVRVDVPYEVTKIKEVEKPVRITQYKTIRDTIETVRVERDTVYVETSEETFQYGSSFLTSYHTTPRFLGLYKRNMELEVTYQKPNGAVEAKKWHLEHNSYEIRPKNGSLELNSYPSRSPQFDYSLSAGWIQSLKYGSPYLQLDTELHFYGVNGVAKANLNQHPFVMVGVEHQF